MDWLDAFKDNGYLELQVITHRFHGPCIIFAPGSWPP